MPTLVWVLNLTPDSFSDGRDRSETSLWEVIQSLIDDGADMIDVGAEATWPHSTEVSEEEELTRLDEFFNIAWGYEIPFSLDTMKSGIARRWLEAGIKMINDVSWGRADPEMFSLMADSDAQYVMMYCKNPTGRADLKETKHKDIVTHVSVFFDVQIEQALQAGMRREQLILDPGMWSFVSTDPDDSRALLQAIPALRERYGLPLYVGTSRKWFLGKKSHDLWSRDRVGSTLASSVYALAQWAEYVRVHDVRWMRQFLDIQAYLDEHK